ncbi:hypothetical protein MY11210_005546 [Beauveria gryllotalpidicola]
MIEETEGLMSTKVERSEHMPARTAPSAKDVVEKEPSTTLHRHPGIAVLTVLYALVSAVSWTLICILTHRPIGEKRNDKLDAVAELQDFYAQSERYLRAARVLQAISSMLVIPLTSAVVAQAAVVSVQRQHRNCDESRPTLRQTVALADKAWIDPTTVWKILAKRRWKQYTSRPFIYGLLLTALGALIAPLQNILLSYQTIKAPGLGDLNRIIDFTDLNEASRGDDQKAVSSLRGALAAAHRKDAQPSLWSSNMGGSKRLTGQNTLTNMSDLLNPFWAELPPNFNTGLSHQFAPRINSTVTSQVSSSTESFPQDCERRSDWIYLRYNQLDTFKGQLLYTFELCWPGNMTASPWKSAPTRQDFSEDIYIRANYTVKSNTLPAELKTGIYFKKMTVNTTFGCFELPNFMNNGTAGPLLHDVPSSSRCGRGRERQTSEPKYFQDETRKFDKMPVMGPLVSFSLAVFGPGSFPDMADILKEYAKKSQLSPKFCVPMLGLIEPSNSLMHSYGNPPCITLNPYTITQIEILRALYLLLFLQDTEDINNAVNSAIFLANESIMKSARGWTSRLISRDLGFDLQVPVVSLAGMIVISVLLAVDLACLLILALKTASVPRWTARLDGFTMMCIGASISDRLPLRVCHDRDALSVLDETPGWLGEGDKQGSENEVNEEETAVRDVMLGGSKGLRRGVRYRCYPAEHEAPAPPPRIIEGVRYPYP